MRWKDSNSGSQFDNTLQFFKVGSQTERLTKKHDTSPESGGPGAVTGVSFKLIVSVFCSQSVFEVGTSCTN